MKKPSQQLIAEVPRKRGQVELTTGIDLGDVWSHYRTLSQQGEVIDRGRLRTTSKAINTWFIDVPHARVAMEAGVHLIVDQRRTLTRKIIDIQDLLIPKRRCCHQQREPDSADRISRKMNRRAF